MVVAAFVLGLEELCNREVHGGKYVYQLQNNIDAHEYHVFGPFLIGCVVDSCQEYVPKAVDSCEYDDCDVYGVD